MRFLSLLTAVYLTFGLSQLANAKEVSVNSVGAATALGVSEDRFDPLGSELNSPPAYPPFKAAGEDINVLANSDFVASHENAFESGDFQIAGSNPQGLEFGATPSDDFNFSLDKVEGANASGVPEPGVWVLILGGLAIVGALLRISKELFAERRSRGTDKSLPIDSE